MHHHRPQARSTVLDAAAQIPTSATLSPAIPQSIVRMMHSSTYHAPRVPAVYRLARHAPAPLQRMDRPHRHPKPRAQTCGAAGHAVFHGGAHVLGAAGEDAGDRGICRPGVRGPASCLYPHLVRGEGGGLCPLKPGSGEGGGVREMLKSGLMPWWQRGCSDAGDAAGWAWETAHARVYASPGWSSTVGLCTVAAIWGLVDLCNRRTGLCKVHEGTWADQHGWKALLSGEKLC